MRKRRLSCLILLFPALFLCWLFMGLSINLLGQTPLQRLESARELWNRQAITDYTMTLAYGTMSEIGRFNFVVQDGAPISVAVWSPILPEQTPAPIEDIKSATFQSHVPYFPPNLADYTIGNLFDFAEQKLANQPTTPLVSWCGMTKPMHAVVTYDDQFGYINSLIYSDTGHWNVGGGLLCNSCNTLECQSSVRILNFEPLK